MAEDAPVTPLVGDPQVRAELQPLEFIVSEVVYEVDDKENGLMFMDSLTLSGAVQPLHGAVT